MRPCRWRNSRQVVRVQLRTYQGFRLVDARAWYEDEHGELRPGQGGLSLRVEVLPELQAALAKAVALEGLDARPTDEDETTDALPDWAQCRQTADERRSAQGATRGGARTRANDISTIFEAPMGEHSEKPQAFFDLVQRASFAPYLEAFARQERAGWSVWGTVH